MMILGRAGSRRSRAASGGARSGGPNAGADAGGVGDRAALSPYALYFTKQASTYMDEAVGKAVASAKRAQPIGYGRAACSDTRGAHSARLSPDDLRCDMRGRSPRHLRPVSRLQVCAERVDADVPSLVDHGDGGYVDEAVGEAGGGDVGGRRACGDEEGPVFEEE